MFETLELSTTTQQNLARIISASKNSFKVSEPMHKFDVSSVIIGLSPVLLLGNSVRVVSTTQLRYNSGKPSMYTLEIEDGQQC